MSDPTVPAERCFWFRFPASPRRWNATRIAALAEPDTPADVDQLQFAWRSGVDGTVVAVAMPCTAIRQAADGAPAAWVLHPDRIPEHVAVPGVEAADLNLLRGACTPPELQRRRRQLAGLAAGLAAVATALLLGGAWHHWRSADTAARQIEADASAILAQRLPASLAGQDPDPLVRLDQARRMLMAVQNLADAGGQTPAVLQAVLARWPVAAHAQIANLSIDGSRLTISGSVASVEEAQQIAAAVAAALADVPGWRMLPLQAARQEHDVVCTIAAQREGR